MKTVTYEQVSTVAMTCGNEKKFSTIIHDGVRKQWVGIGWVSEGVATIQDRKKYPTVVSSKRK